MPELALKKTLKDSYFILNDKIDPHKKIELVMGILVYKMLSDIHLDFHKEDHSFEMPPSISFYEIYQQRNSTIINDIFNIGVSHFVEKNDEDFKDFFDKIDFKNPDGIAIDSKEVKKLLELWGNNKIYFDADSVTRTIRNCYEYLFTNFDNDCERDYFILAVEKLACNLG